MKALTYLIYIVLWEGLMYGGTGYAVFVLGHSGWWFVAAFYVSSHAYTPLMWIHGQAKEKRQPSTPPSAGTSKE